MHLSRSADYVVLDGRFLVAEVVEREGRSIVEVVALASVGISANVGLRVFPSHHMHVFDLPAICHADRCIEWRPALIAGQFDGGNVALGIVLGVLNSFGHRNSLSSTVRTALENRATGV